ncbi:hypothetical protein DSECCO2_484110 [anaerobic digester metagenome]
MQDAITIDEVSQKGTQGKTGGGIPAEQYVVFIHGRTEQSDRIGNLHKCCYRIARHRFAAIINRCNVIVIAAIGKVAIAVTLAGGLPDHLAIPVDGIAE